tara:strand:+ start:156 stop:1901 length:1746 start_codon:yes stop_codon:yes gene_type:complete
MPFRYTPNQNRYVGSIADLMGRGNDAEAQALIASANAQARAAQASGQAWGGAVQGIGNTVSQAITDWNSPEARRQRELEKAREIFARGSEQERVLNEPFYRRTAGEIVGPPFAGELGESTTRTSSPIRVNTVEEAGPFGAPPTEAELDRMQSGQPLGEAFTERNSITKSYPYLKTGPDPGTVMPVGAIENRERTIRGYITDEGLFDPRRAAADMSAGNVRPDVINEILGNITNTNKMFSDFDALEAQSDEDRTVLMGRLAADALRQAELQVLSIDDAIDVNLAALELRFGKDVVNDLRVQLHNLSPEEKQSALTNAAKSADDIVGHEVFTPGQTRRGMISGLAETPAGTEPLKDQLSKILTLTPGTEAYDAAVTQYGDMTRAMSQAEIEQFDSGLDLEQQQLNETIRHNKRMEDLNLASSQARAGRDSSTGESDSTYDAQLTNDIISVGNDLLDHEGFEGAFGALDAAAEEWRFPAGLTPKTIQETTDARVLRDNLMDKMTLESLELMTGTLTEADMVILRNAKTRLDGRMSEEAARTEITRILELMTKSRREQARQHLVERGRPSETENVSVFLDNNPSF